MILQDEQDARQKRKGDGLNSSGHGLTDESDNDELNESELIELPIFLHKLFDWLLDHHAVRFVN